MPRRPPPPLPWRTALVTGASSGIGRELARRLAQAGVEVVLSARREGELRDLHRTIVAEGGRAHVLPLDVADTDATVAAIRELDAELRLDLVVANAGLGVAEGDLPSWDRDAIGPALHVNFTSAAATLTAALPGMVSRGRGHLVAISSLSSYAALPQAQAYCSPKAGLNMLLDCLRLDLASTGACVTTVYAGFVRTRMIQGATHPMPWLLEVDDAVAILMRKPPRMPARVAFPWQLAWLARLGSWLPDAARRWVLRVR